HHLSRRTRAHSRAKVHFNLSGHSPDLSRYPGLECPESKMNIGKEWKVRLRKHTRELSRRRIATTPTVDFYWSVCRAAHPILSFRGEDRTRGGKHVTAHRGSCDVPNGIRAQCVNPVATNRQGVSANAFPRGQ